MTFAGFPFWLCLIHSIHLKNVANLFLCSMHDIFYSIQTFHNTKLDFFFFFYQQWLLNSAAKRLCDGQRKEAHHSQRTGQEQGYSFVSAFITEKMSLSLADIVEAARL